MMGARLTAGLQTLNLYMEVRILRPQPNKSTHFLMNGFLFFKVNGNTFLT
jgi:hypothetical protein